MISWTARSSPQLAVRSLLLARYTASGTTCQIESFDVGRVPESATRADSISRTSKGGDIFLDFSYRDAHHIVEGYFIVASGLSACDNFPLLAFNNVRMDPHCLSLRSRDRDKSFLLQVVRISIDHSKFSFWDGNHTGWC